MCPTLTGPVGSLRLWQTKIDHLAPHADGHFGPETMAILDWNVAADWELGLFSNLTLAID